MARKKKLNKSVVVFLSIVGVLVVAGGLYLFLKNLPKDPDADIRQADQLFADKKYTEALELYGRAIGTAQKSGSLKAEYYLKAAHCHREMASKMVQLTETERLEHLKGVRNNLATALKVDGKYLDARRELAELVWNEDARGPYRNWDRYVEQADRLLELAPKDDTIWDRRGIACTEWAKLHKTEQEFVREGEKSYQKAIELNKDQSQYWVDLANHRKEFDQAKVEDTYKKAIQVFTTRAATTQTAPATQDAPSPAAGVAMLRVEYGVWLLSQGAERKKDALDQFELANHPKSLPGSLALAQYYMIEKQPEKANQCLQDAKTINATDVRIYLFQNQCYLDLRKPDQAIQALRDGLKALAARTETSDLTLMEQIGLEGGRAELNYRLAYTLLDMADTSTKPEDRDKYVQEANGCVNALAARPFATPIILGRIAMIKGKLEDAVRILETAYKDTRSAAEPRVGDLLTEAYMRQNFPGKALEIARTQLKAPWAARDPWRHNRVARILIQCHNYAEAEKELGVSLGIQSDNSDTQNLLDQVRALQTDSVTQDTHVSEQNAMAYMQRALDMLGQGNPEGALKLGRDVYSRMPESLPVIGAMAQLCLNTNNDKEAGDILEKARVKYPDNQAIKDFLAILRLTPEERTKKNLENADKNADPAERAFQRAMVYRSARMKDEFVREVQQGYASNPNSILMVDLQFQLALVEKGKEDWKLAQECADRANKIDKDFGRRYRARIDLAKGDPGSAVKELLEVLKDRPESKQDKVELANCYMQLRKYPEAEALYNEVAKVDPGHAEAVRGMAVVTEAEGKMKEHQEWIMRAYELVPQDPYVSEKRLSADEVKPANRAKAIVQREEIRKKDPQNAMNLVRLAWLYEVSGQPKMAEAILQDLYERSMKTDPIQGAELWLQFLVRQNNSGEIENVLNRLVDNPKDAVGAWVLRGNIRMAQRKQDLVPEAEKSFKTAIDKDPKDIRGHLAMAKFLATTGKWADAAQQLREVLAIESSINVEKQLIGCLINANLYDEAKTRAQRLSNSAPNDPEVCVLMNLLCRHDQNLDEALKYLNRAVEANPKLADPLLRRADLMIVRQDLDKAREDIQSVRRQESPSAEDLMVAAGFYVRMHDLDRAKDTYGEIRKAYPRYLPALGELCGIFMEKKDWVPFDRTVEDALGIDPGAYPFLLVQAKGYQRRGMDEEAIKCLEAAFKISQDGQVVVAYVNALLDRKDIATARKVLDQVAKNTSLATAIEAFRARALVLEKKDAEAQVLFSKTLQDASGDQLGFVVAQVEAAYGEKEGLAKMQSWMSLRPNDALMLMHLGTWYARVRTPENLAKAAEMFAKARDTTDKPGLKLEAQISLGEVLQGLKKNDEAEKCYLAVLKTNPDVPNCLNNLAYLYAETNRGKEALEYAKKAKELMPNNADVLDTYGWALAKCEQYDEARQVLQAALLSSNPSVVCRVHLGYVFEKTGDLTNARTQYQSVLEILGAKTEEPAYIQAQDGLERIKKVVRRSTP